MKLAIFAKTFEGDAPKAVLTAARQAGYAAVQYNMACSGLGALPSQIPDAAVETLGREAADAGVDIAAISATYNMVHPDRSKREAGRHSFAVIAAAARRVGCPMVTVCTGSRDPVDQWRGHPDNETVEAWNDMVAEFGALVPVAEKEGVTIGIEPELANVVASPEKARRLLDLFPSGPLKIVLDPANLFESGEGEEIQRTIGGAIDMLGPYIGLAHAKDRRADGRFVAAGKGVVDFRRFIGGLRRAGFDGPLVTHGLAAHEARDVAAFLSAAIKSSGAM